MWNDSNVAFSQNLCTDKSEQVGTLSWWRDQSLEFHFASRFHHTLSYRCCTNVGLQFVWNKFTKHNYLNVKKQTMSMFFTFEQTNMGQHTLVLKKTLLNNCTCYNLTPSKKWLSRLYSIYISNRNLY